MLCVWKSVRVLFDKEGVDGLMLEDMFEKKINQVFRFPLLVTTGLRINIVYLGQHVCTILHHELMQFVGAFWANRAFFGMFRCSLRC
eukprot:scaffold19441_cov214-Skeletonema_marinoi.AAC.7